MATKQKRGWIWTGKEKDWIKAEQRDLRTEYNRIDKQCNQFRDLLPDFADDADGAAADFKRGYLCLLSIDGRNQGRKYQPMSPKETKRILSKIPDKLQPWVDFVNRPDVQTAIEEVNKGTRAENREFRKKKRAVKKNALEHIESQEFSDMLEKQIATISKETPGMAGMIRALKGYGKTKDCPLLGRLILIHFVRFTYECNVDRRDEMEEFVSVSPTPTFREVLKYALRVMIKDEIMHRIKKPKLYKSFLGSRGITDGIPSLLAGAFEGLLKSVEEWKDDGISPQKIDKKYFTILGVDYSLKAKPK